MMVFERKKINCKKTRKKREEISLLSLFCFIFYHPPLVVSSSFGFVCSKHSIKVYSYHLHDDAEKRIVSKRKKKQK